MTKIQTEEIQDGQKYFKIYEIRVLTQKSETKTIEIFLSKEKAKKYVKFIEKYYKRLYIKAWTIEQIVWC